MALDTLADLINAVESGPVAKPTPFSSVLGLLSGQKSAPTSLIPPLDITAKVTQTPMGNVPPPSGPVVGAAADVGDPVAPDLSPTAKAFLNATAHGESSGRYDVRYSPSGDKRFFGFDAHPGIYEPGPAGPSSAAGRYQFTKQTWDELGGGPFDPATQDRRAWGLAQERYRRKTGRDLEGDLTQQGFTPQIARTLGDTWTAFKVPKIVRESAMIYKNSLDKYSQQPKPMQDAGTVVPGQAPEHDANFEKLLQTADPQVKELVAEYKGSYPTVEDAKRYGEGVAYGKPFAAYMEKNAAPKINRVSLDQVIENLKAPRGARLPDQLEQSDEKTRTQLQRAYMAIQHSPVAYLGFNPDKMSFTNDPEYGLNVRGFFDPSTKQLWQDQRAPTVIVHESIHAGMDQIPPETMKKIQTTYKVPSMFTYTDDEGKSRRISLNEATTRALMLKNFGDVEEPHSEVQFGKEFLKKYPEFLNKVEQAAQEITNKRKPERGPA